MFPETTPGLLTSHSTVGKAGQKKEKNNKKKHNKGTTKTKKAIVEDDLWVLDCTTVLTYSRIHFVVLTNEAEKQKQR
jgi:hypothetical protein